MSKVRRRAAIDASVRLIKLLTLIPRAPQKVSSRQLHERLAAESIDVTLRSVQRDLARLSSHFAITSDDAKPEAGWQWARGASELSAPGLDDRAALAWVLAGEYLEALLPSDIKAALRPRFDAARKVLSQTPFARTRRWAERVAAKPKGYQLLPPKLEAGVPEAVQQALLDRRRLQIHYLRPSDDETSEAEISVLGLVVRGSVTYLVAVFWEYDDPRLLVMHRIKKAKVVDTASREPGGFDFRSYVESGVLDWPIGPLKKIRLIIAEDLARILDETPICSDQKIVRRGSGWATLTGTVIDSVELRDLIKSWGNRVKGGVRGQSRSAQAHRRDLDGQRKR